MALSALHFLLLLGCGALVVSGYVVTDDEIRRVLESLGSEDNSAERRHLTSCRTGDQSCDLFHHCCGDLQCYWGEEGYKAFTEGWCVACVSEGETCQKDSKCCGELQCNKKHLLQVNGSCQKKRRHGACYRDGQCVNDCNKRWYKLKGICT